MENSKYLAIIIDNSVITCHEIIGEVETKTVTINFDEKNIICETKCFYISLVFLLITIILLTAVSIYFYLVKYWAQQKHLLSY